MENKKNLFLVVSSLFVVALVAGLVVYQKNGGGNILNLSPSISPTTSSLPSISSNVTPKISASPSLSPISNTVPKCQLSGEIIYDGEVFTHVQNQEFHYQEVYDPHDIIKWEISPSGENFRIGPNRVSGLTPQQGSDYLTISFNELMPKYERYSLKASIDYIISTPDGAKIMNEKCSGKTTLTIK